LIRKINRETFWSNLSDRWEGAKRKGQGVGTEGGLLLEKGCRTELNTHSLAVWSLAKKRGEEPGRCRIMTNRGDAWV